MEKFTDALVVVVFTLFVLIATLFLAEEAEASGTSCEEWATFSQILVLRWQGQHLPKPDGTQANNEDVKAELRKSMKGHPELDEALEWVDYAWKNREGNPVHVWQNARMKCEGTI